MFPGAYLVWGNRLRRPTFCHICYFVGVLIMGSNYGFESLENIKARVRLETIELTKRIDVLIGPILMDFARAQGWEGTRLYSDLEKEPRYEEELRRFRPGFWMLYGSARYWPPSDDRLKPGGSAGREDFENDARFDLIVPLYEEARIVLQWSQAEPYVEELSALNHVLSKQLGLPIEYAVSHLTIVTCATCNGAGTKPCRRCLGRGILTSSTVYKSEQQMPCDDCLGAGKQTCRACKGMGAEKTFDMQRYRQGAKSLPTSEE